MAGRLGRRAGLSGLGRSGNEKKKADLLVSEIEHALDLGQFITYNRSWDFVRELEDTEKRIDALVKNGEAELAVGLYEMFLSGCGTLGTLLTMLNNSGD